MWKDLLAAISGSLLGRTIGRALAGKLREVDLSDVTESILEKARRLSTNDSVKQEDRVFCQTCRAITSRQSGISMEPRQDIAGHPLALVVPIGIINMGNPKQAYREVLAIAKGNGQEYQAAAVLAAAQAVALLPQANRHTVLEAIVHFASMTIFQEQQTTTETSGNTSGLSHLPGMIGVLHNTWPEGPHALMTAALEVNFSNQAAVEVMGGLVGGLYGANAWPSAWTEVGEMMGRRALEDSPWESIDHLSQALARVVVSRNPTLQGKTIHGPLHREK